MYVTFRKYDPAKTQPATNSTQLPGATAPRELDVSSIYGRLHVYQLTLIAGPLKHTLNSQVLKEHNLTGREINEKHPLNTPATMPR